VRGDLTARADLRVTIPMPGALESLNVARRRGDLLLRGEPAAENRGT
jgi:hypothetical protein